MQIFDDIIDWHFPILLPYNLSVGNGCEPLPTNTLTFREMSMSEGNSTVEYREHPDFPGYRIGSDGTVWTRWIEGVRPMRQGTQWREMKQNTSIHGYRFLTLGIGSKRCQRFVHRLVLEAFVGPRPKGYDCRHFPDQTRTNNNFSNISWATKSVNCRDKLPNDYRGEVHHQAKITEADVRAIRIEYASGKISMHKLAVKYGVTYRPIVGIIRRTTWKHVD